MDWINEDGARWLEARLPGARAAFSTRLGGVSRGPFESLNLGIHTDDDRDAVLENRRLLASSLDFGISRVAIGRQVHGAELAVHAAAQARWPFAEPDAAIAEVDGHVLNEPGLAALVFVADCLPVALVGPRGVAILHCGWRGLAAGIIARGAAATGATDAAIGPGIGACCYEVGTEVLDAFAGLGPGISHKRKLNLSEVARRLLERAGVKRVDTAGLCTSCEGSLFFSHRRDGKTGRQAGVAWLEDRA